MRSSKYTEHYTDTFITFKEIMRTVSNIYHNCVPDKIKNRRNTDQLKGSVAKFSKKSILV
ncbi:hypothetical protein WQ1_01825 [Enterococcus faecium EnGen0371]|nr:hypothetical protein WQ1_01825 [Enterococcus faecium EnGen0371]EOM51171.1 hypothetical protein SKW_00249 [Enterococcus faecium EnGen0174]